MSGQIEYTLLSLGIKTDHCCPVFARISAHWNFDNFWSAQICYELWTIFWPWKPHHWHQTCVFFLKRNIILQVASFFLGANLSFPGNKSIPNISLPLLPDCISHASRSHPVNGVEATARVAATSCFLVQGEAPGKQPWVAWTQDQLIWWPFMSYQSFAKTMSIAMLQNHILPNCVWCQIEQL